MLCPRFSTSRAAANDVLTVLATAVSTPALIQPYEVDLSSLKVVEKQKGSLVPDLTDATRVITVEAALDPLSADTLTATLTASAEPALSEPRFAESELSANVGAACFVTTAEGAMPASTTAQPAQTPAPQYYSFAGARSARYMLPAGVYHYCESLQMRTSVPYIYTTDFKSYAVGIGSIDIDHSFTTATGERIYSASAGFNAQIADHVINELGDYYVTTAAVIDQPQRLTKVAFLR